MSRDERQIRTTGNQVLVGYRANYHGNRVIAIMKGAEKNSWKCLDIIHPDELVQMLNTGPCINLDNLYNQ